MSVRPGVKVIKDNITLAAFQTTTNKLSTLKPHNDKIFVLSRDLNTTLWQGGRSWQPFGEGKNGPANFRQAPPCSLVMLVTWYKEVPNSLDNVIVEMYFSVEARN